MESDSSNADADQVWIELQAVARDDEYMWAASVVRDLQIRTLISGAIAGASGLAAILLIWQFIRDRVGPIVPDQFNTVARLLGIVPSWAWALALAAFAVFAWQFGTSLFHQAEHEVKIHQMRHLSKVLQIAKRYGLEVSDTVLMLVERGPMYQYTAQESRGEFRAES